VTGAGWQDQNTRAPAREASFDPVLVYALGALRADREGGGPSVEGEEAVLHVIERIVAPLVFGSTQRHLGWTRDFRTALGCRPNLLAPFCAADPDHLQTLATCPVNDEGGPRNSEP